MHDSVHKSPPLTHSDSIQSNSDFLAIIVFLRRILIFWSHQHSDLPGGIFPSDCPHNPKVNVHVLRSSSLDPIASQFNPIRVYEYFFKTRINIVLPFKLRPPKWPLLFSNQYFYMTLFHTMQLHVSSHHIFLRLIAIIILGNEYLFKLSYYTFISFLSVSLSLS